MAHRFEVYQDKTNKFRFRFRAGNGNIMAAGSDTYTSVDACKQIIARIQSGDIDADYYQDKAGEHRWRILDGDDILCVASEGYSSKQSAIESFESVTQRAPDSDIDVRIDA